MCLGSTLLRGVLQTSNQFVLCILVDTSFSTRMELDKKTAKQEDPFLKWQRQRFQQRLRGERCAPVPAEDPEIIFQRNIMMPQAARQRLQPQLIAEEWSAPITRSSELNHKGGIALCYKQELPDALRRVGYTLEPTAVLLSQEPSSLGLRAYPSELVTCGLKVTKDDGSTQIVQVERHLCQLGFGEHVCKVASGTLVLLPTCMHRCVAKYPSFYGWTSEMINGSTIAQLLSKHLPQGSFSEVVPRLHDRTLSATFRVHSDLLDTILKVSGLDHVFYKPHDSESVRPNMELLWLPQDANLDIALAHTKNSPDIFGVAMKNASAQPRFALRFLDITKLQQYAKENSLDDVSHLGRWKLQGVPVHSGPIGALTVLQDRKWDVREIIYFNARHCIFVAAARGDASPIYFENGKHRQQLRFEAVNAVARQQQAEAAQAARPSKPDKVATKTDSANAFWKKTAKEAVAMNQPGGGSKRPADSKTGLTPEKNKQKAENS